MWKSILGRDDDEDRDEDFFNNQTNDGQNHCALSYTKRLYGFAACLISGLLFIFLSMVVFIKPIKFALLFTFGNMLAVGSTAFLIGLVEQLRKMFDPIRIYATAVYLGCAVLALICAVLIHSKILTILAMICEICALIWYSLTYIPFARRVVSDVMIRHFDTEI
ncbi:uncharacterized protein LOC130805925 [Amaranthus tricolor]|uniref:uncharacterized protein LOC130805925 n=1 Tax=Amaranthus tricolor TaxID=29722 RepID=UPI00258F668D|nr:uncharacterized protein LOC130805925 [Amaranthus tricolor]